MNLISVLFLLVCFIPSLSRQVDWRELQNILRTGNLSQLSRSTQTERGYFELKSTLKNQNLTIPEYVKDKVFGFKAAPKEPISLVANMSIEGATVPVYVAGTEPVWRGFLKNRTASTIVPGIEQGSEFILFAKNDFSYDLWEINHWVIWSSSSMTQDLVQLLLRETIDERVETLTYQNPPQLKSIPEINHFQFFWKTHDALSEL